MNRKILVVAIALSLAGCAHNKPQVVYQTQQVKVPVAVKRQAPAELLTPVKPDKELRFVEPSNPAATSALTDSGERALRKLIRDLNSKLNAWSAWSTAE